MRVVSLFAGIGGFDKAFENAGFKTAGQVEIDPYARKVLTRHWPDTPKHDDITTAHGMMFGPADVVTFGSPCQDLSVAGKRAGLSGERSGLFMEAVRFIREMREGTGEEYPKYAVWENVPGAFSSNGGRDFAVVLRELANVGALDLAWRILDSRHFGVAQRRRRIFLVADFGGERAGQILFESESVRRNPEAGGSEGQDVAACLTTGTGQRYDAETETLIPTYGLQWHLGYGPQATAKGSPSLTNSDGTPPAVAQPNPLAFDSKAHESRSMNPHPLTPALEAQSKVAVCFQQNQRDEVRLVMGDGQTAGALCADAGMKQQNFMAISTADGLASTLTASAGHHGFSSPRGDGSDNLAVTPYAVRRLTPLECERLQAFPDGWTALTDDGKAIPDTHRYRMCGNAVTVSTVQWIAQRMAAA